MAPGPPSTGWASAGKTYLEGPAGFSAQPSGSPVAARNPYLKRLWTEANQGRRRKIRMATAIGKLALGAAVGRVPILGSVVTVTKHMAAIDSTVNHRDVLAKMDHRTRCTCGDCGDNIEYILRKKRTKVIVRTIQIGEAIPVYGQGVTGAVFVGRKLKWLYKKGKGTVGVNRQLTACALWSNAKIGCQCAQEIVSELLSDHSETAAAMIECLTNWDGVLALKAKVSSA